MPVLDLTKTELQYLAKMHAENMTVMRFLEGKGATLRDLTIAQGLHEKFIELLPEDIPDVLTDFRKRQAEVSPKTKRMVRERVPAKKIQNPDGPK